MQNSDKIIKKLYIKSYEPDKYGQVDLSLPNNRLLTIGVKILDNSSKGPLTYDVARLYDELVYFNHYSHKGEACPLNFFLPMILVNRSYVTYESSLLDLAGKILSYYGRLGRLDDYILQVISYDRLIRAYIRSGGQSLEGDRLIPILRDIKAGLVAYNLTKETKRETIDFQLKKVKYIEKIHRLIDSLEGVSTYNIDMSSHNTNMDDLDIFDRIAWLEGGQEGGDSLTRVLAYILGYENVSVKVDNEAFGYLRSDLEEDDKGYERSMYGEEIGYKAFVSSMADYLLDLRNRDKITRKYGARSSPKHFLSEDVGYQGQDPILNRYRILEKAREGNSYRVRLATKSGLYDMIYNIKTCGD